MRKTYNITIRATIDVKQGDGKKLAWISFKGWKYGIVSNKNRFIKTDPMVKKTSGNMQRVGEEIFGAVKEMAREDGIFLAEDIE